MLISGLAVLAIKEDNGWAPAIRYTPFLLAVIKGACTLILY